jgi:hypothetical protein
METGKVQFVDDAAQPSRVYHIHVLHLPVAEIAEFVALAMMVVGIVMIARSHLVSE